MDLYDRNGQRKYLTPEERDVSESRRRAGTRSADFCGTLLYTGCRISEALGLTADRIDLKARRIVFESLKRRKKGIYRAVPVPPAFLDTLDLFTWPSART
jgi:integrase/recombinase XerD